MALPRFTADQREDPELHAAWRRDGVVVIDGFFAPSSVASLRERARALRERCAAEAPDAVFDATDQEHGADAWFRESGGEIRAFFEPKMPAGLPASERASWVNKLGHALHDEDPVFDRLLRTPALASVVHTLGCEAPFLVQSMVIFKEGGGVGDAVPAHQDATFLATEPQSVIGLWIALDPATSENGCLAVLPGGHRGPLRSRYVRDDERLRMVTESEVPFPLDGWEEIHAAPGALVAFHGFLPHRSRENHGSRSRWAVTLHVVDGRASWNADNWLVRTRPFRGFAPAE